MRRGQQLVCLAQEGGLEGGRLGFGLQIACAHAASPPSLPTPPRLQSAYMQMPASARVSMQPSCSGGSAGSFLCRVELPKVR